MGDGEFQVCSAQLVAHTGGGRTALQLKCHAKDTTIILEAIVDQETWLWMPRACNDINVLHRSTLFARLSNEESPPVEFQADDHTYKGYYLAGGIYLKWATFVMPFPSPQGKKQLGFHSAQADDRKDVKRIFGIMQAQFANLQGPARFFEQEIL